MSATLLVTGGAGFIGSHFAHARLERGDDVVCLDNLDPFYDLSIKHAALALLEEGARRFGRRFHFVNADIRDPQALACTFAAHPITDLVHLAALAGVLPSVQRPADYWDVNLVGSQRVMDAALSAGVTRALFASSSSVYGEGLAMPLREDMTVDRPLSPYAATKKAGELLCHAAHRLHGLSVACLRFFTVYGPRQRPDLAIHKFLLLASRGKALPIFGDGGVQRDFTWIDDIVQGMHAALDFVRQETRYEIFNLGESHTISVNGLLDLMERAWGSPFRRDYLPPQRGDVPRTWADITKARRLLGYDPKTPIEDGIVRFVSWFRTAHGVP